MPAATPINSIKQAGEFGIVKGGQKLAGLLVFITDVHSLGLQAGAGPQLTEAFYWDLNDETRAFAKRFAEKIERQDADQRPGRLLFGRPALPRSGQGRRHRRRRQGDGEDEARRRSTTRSSARATIRADGRKMHDMYLFEVKTPAESKGPWDYYKLIRTIPGEEAFRPMERKRMPVGEEGLSDHPCHPFLAPV